MKSLKPSWGSDVRVSMEIIGIPSHATLEDHPLDPRREPSALEDLILEIFCCDPKESRACLRILLTKGQRVRLRWATSKLKGPNGRSPRPCRGAPPPP